MNERIQELIKQATNPNYDSDDGPMNELNVEKFAELIVKECRDMFVVGSVSWNLLNEKLENVGVEE